MRLRGPRRALTAAIPASVHYRPSTDPARECGTCAYDASGHCTMFDADVEAANVCDEWAATKPKPAAAIHNDALKQAEKDALDLEEHLVEVLTPILADAGKEAARAFTQHAQRSLHAATLLALSAEHGPAALRALALTAAGEGGVTATSTMIAVKPRPEEAAQLAQAGGLDPGTLHVTLAYLGETQGPLENVAAALRPVAANHAPLVGQVGGIGAFGDNGNGFPIILLPSVPGLVELRVDATEALADAAVDFATNHGYIPHMTVDYAQDGDGKDREGVFEAVGTPLHFDQLLIVRGDTEVIPLPLIGPKPVTASSRRDRLVEAIQAALAENPTGVPVLRIPADQVDQVALVAAGIVEEIAAAAEKNMPDGGYGETCWNESTETVWWNCGDWTTDDEMEAAEQAFLAIEGVEAVDICDECGLPEGDEWEVVWTRPVRAAGPPSWGKPHPDQVIDVPGLVAKLRTKTDPIRQAAVESVMKSTLNGAGIAWDVTNPFTARVLAQAGSQVTGIGNTTQLNVMRVIKESYEQGLSIPDTAKAIQAGMADAAADRARLIARTELAGAVNGGSLAAVHIVAKATGDTYTKTWLTAPGALYPRHEDYDGLDEQSVPLAGYFDVGGYSLQHPGDPAGPPEEVCNCRCTMVYEGAGGNQEESDAGDE